MRKKIMMLVALALLLCACESGKTTNQPSKKLRLEPQVDTPVDQTAVISELEDKIAALESRLEEEDEPSEEPEDAPEDVSEEPSVGPKETESPAPVEISESEDDGVTFYDCGPLRVPIPDEYVPQLTIERGEESAGPLQPLLCVYETASLEASMEEGYRAGFLFEIDAVEPGRHDEFLEMDLPGSWFFARDESHYYVYTEPTDVQYYRKNGDESGWAQWQVLCGLGEQVREDLLRGGALEPYSAVLPEPVDYGGDYGGGYDGGAVLTVPEAVDCAACGGTGFCWNCIGGQCSACLGNGRRLCEDCTGFGHCGYCGGDGYSYTGVGLMFRKVNCSKCRGSGGCALCGNTGYISCSVCGGTGNCGICGGTGFCTFCGGMGKIY